MSARELGGARSRRRPVRGWADDRGAVAAEFAVSLPAIVAVIVITVGALGACARHVRLQDAVADAARMAARGESAQRVHDVIAAIDGATGVVERGPDDMVCVHATLDAGLGIELSATGCAIDGGG
ncbi:TadE family type IV pilus minor pilin [Microbacterium sp. C7(2022)]|uniref:TadE family type IV pilus minor pilin n=1 Tax=Microbacterium sp. C7(2022) TaxID=2992759 RepID=UPI00237A2B2D|nr:TadE family type IV pilus minor pilin [Microbacterium sp. C7(2022)]MDE0546006.1 hypothetical protein [Microbacterium sp. C7(2022)]